MEKWWDNPTAAVGALMGEKAQAVAECQIAKKLQAEYERGLQEGKDKWICVFDEEPELFEQVLVTDGSYIDFGYLQCDGSYCHDAETLEGPVLYWMPLPELPKVVSE